MELSEGEGRVRVKAELTSPQTSPLTSRLDEPLDGTAGSCVFCKKHFGTVGELRDHISRVHVSDRLEKQFKVSARSSSVFCIIVEVMTVSFSVSVRLKIGLKDASVFTTMG